VTRVDALVVGGGPAGSTCARQLARAGWKVAVADRARFPRDKVCAGWLTPDVFPLLDLDPADYRATGLTFQEISGFRTGVIGDRPPVETRYTGTVSYAIRRYEFDDFLLRRSGARVLENTPITSLRWTGTTWIANESLEAPVLIGAGGHFCPVARHLQGHADEAAPVVAKEAEFPVGTHATRVGGSMPELFFCRDLQGYGWCVRKGDYLNVGIGRRDSEGFSTHVGEFVAFLERHGIVSRAAEPRWRGHAYLAWGAGIRPIVAAGALLVGDAAGLAYPESGEGIKPAIASGRLAADVLIAAGGRFAEADLQPYAREIRRLYPQATERSAPARKVLAALGRLLLGSTTFTRHVVLDRWFLRATS
jgi:geranylgeranyl reductase family protein